MRRVLVSLLLLAGAGGLAWRLYRGPDPEAILAGLDVPPAPVLTAEEELRTFRTAPGFRVELVAAEPLVVDPVAIDWDDEGRLFVVEMRGFMPDLDGAGEDAPVGRVAVLEDTDGDGRMDRRDTFLDGLVLPRAIAVLPEGVLVAEPPDLWLCRDTDQDRRCDEKVRLVEYGTDASNPEHQENALLPGIDNWIYNAASDRRFRLRGRALEVAETERRGQWGLAQDDDGRLFYNHNSAFLYGDAVPADYAMRQPATAARLHKAGVSVPLADGAEVHGVRVAPGLNRAYLPGALRADGRQREPTAVSGLAIQRGDQYGPDLVGDAFVPEAGGSVVAHFAIDRRGTELSAEHVLYGDETWGEREFLASTHERFRPVDVEVGPDGALWVVDMYRGVIQHTQYASDHLRSYVRAHDLEAPGATGRIWRIVRTDRPLPRRPPRLDGLGRQLEALDHPNGWVRDRAQRRIAHARAPEAVAALRRLDDFGPLGRRHALWTLEAMDALDADTWRRALSDPGPGVRIAALRAGEALLWDDPSGTRDEVVSLLDDDDHAVRVQALHTLGALPAPARPLDLLLRIGRDGDPLLGEAAASGLSGIEAEALEHELARADDLDEVPDDWLARLSAAALLGARETEDPDAGVRRVLDLVASAPSEAVRVALLEGVAEAQRSPGNPLVALDAPHPLFDPGTEKSPAVSAAIARVRSGFTWPGDPRPGGARPLGPDEERRREAGGALYADACAPCHGADGRGQPDRAPALAGSPWVRDAEEWLVRIVLDGLTGPVRIDGQEWNLTMPGHRSDVDRFDDDALAGLATHLRRSFGHAEDPVAPEAVARIRAATRDRSEPWTVAELRELPVEHRLDRYAGVYAVPVVGTELVIGRQDSVLTVGQRGTGAAALEEAGNGLFLVPDLSLQFETDESGLVTGARASYRGMPVPLTKTE